MLAPLFTAHFALVKYNNRNKAKTRGATMGQTAAGAATSTSTTTFNTDTHARAQTDTDEQSKIVYK